MSRSPWLRSGGRLGLFGFFARRVGRAGSGLGFLSGGVLGRPLILGAVRLGAGVEVRVPAAALELERGRADLLLDLPRLALRANADRLVRHLLPLFELVAAGGAGVLVNRHAAGALSTAPRLSSRQGTRVLMRAP